MGTLARHIAAAMAGGWFFSHFWPIDFWPAAAGAWFFYLLFEKPNDRATTIWSPGVIAKMQQARNDR